MHIRPFPHAKKIGALIAAVTVAATVGIAVQGAGASASDNPQFLGWAGGSEVIAASGVVTSNLTAASALNTPATGATNSNHLASTTVAGLLTVGAVQTAVASKKITGGVEFDTHAQTAGVSALGGLITVSAVDTRVSTTSVNGVATSTSATTFAGIKIAGVKLPITIPKNYVVRIPGVATVELNGSVSTKGTEGRIQTNASAIYIALLAEKAGNPAGTVAYLNPSHAQIGVANPVDLPILHGVAFGSEVTVNGGSILNVSSGPSAYSSIPPGGTQGVDVNNATAGVNIPGIVTGGAVHTTANGTVNSSVSTATMTAQIAGVNVLNGLVKVGAITGVAKVTKEPGKSPVVTSSSSIASLVIDGKPISVTTKPNTVIKIAGVATITINGQIKSVSQAGVVALEIDLLKAEGSAPAGAQIDIGVAGAWLSNF